MKSSIKITLCCIAIAASVGAFTTATLASRAKPVEAEKAQIDFVVVNGAIPCVITSKAGVPTVISCKWDHIIFQDDEPAETPKASWRA